MNLGSTDLNDPAMPEGVPIVLRNAAQKMREQASELQSAWQDRNAGKIWARIATMLERTADNIERIV